MTKSVRGKYIRLLGGGALLFIGVGLIVYTFSSPIASTLVACPDSMTQWELFGFSLPIVRSVEISLTKMQLSWYDGCNTNLTSLWIPLGGSLGFLLGAIITVHELRAS
ncbi:hypothetical protein [Halocatena salina]|uniref:Transmembrane protein n=1 Tax=Halocatena salina TaxID=2934340 RepID=A0A8U0A482_9EURY|nr:hypothetical protein [Halocatena salina]UPM43892.1 hypothetical protein MW046_05460 [Halocatena salina]